MPDVDPERVRPTEAQELQLATVLTLNLDAPEKKGEPYNSIKHMDNA